MPKLRGEPTFEAMATVDWKKICCPVDFSEASRGALKAAAELAARFDAELTLLHVYRLPGATMPEGTPVADPQRGAQLAIEVEDRLTDWKKEAEGLGARRVNARSALGEAFVEIVRFAREGKFGVIVMGTHGHSALRQALLGSTADRVVRKASCAVLTIRPEGHTYEAP